MEIGELPVKSNLGKTIAQQPYVDSSSIEKQWFALGTSIENISHLSSLIISLL